MIHIKIKECCLIDNFLRFFRYIKMIKLLIFRKYEKYRQKLILATSKITVKKKKHS